VADLAVQRAVVGLVGVVLGGAELEVLLDLVARERLGQPRAYLAAPSIRQGNSGE
jgi:hypothetical protein